MSASALKFCVIIFATLFILQSPLKAQTNYTKLIDSAYSFYQKKEYSKAGSYYTKSFTSNNNLGTQTDRYNSACSWSLAEKPDLAFTELNNILLGKGIVAGSGDLTKLNRMLIEDADFKNLHSDKRWTLVVSKAKDIESTFLKKLEGNQIEFEASGFKSIAFSKIKTGKEIYQMIKSFNNFKTKKELNYSIKFKVNDSLNTSYFVCLPKNYNAKKRYSLLFFLHGAVQFNSFADFQNKNVMDGWNRYYTKYAALNNVIMVYPQGSKKYNWMAPDDGFFMIPAMLKEIKQSINIDDDKVFITGHSNGATGSFNYLMKQQSPFAGFYGFNTQPKVRNGGTFIRNIANRSYFNVSTDEDYYYPPNANDSLNVMMTNLKADYQDHRYNGWPHWFPQFDESEPVYPMIFRDIAGRNRNPFRKDIYWECDNLNYGATDWVKITSLDTLAKPASWQTQLNFNIHKLLSYDKDENLITKDTLLKAFNFPRKSGAVKGHFNNNEFHMEISNVKSFRLLISPEMVDVSRPVIVFVNGVKKLEQKVIYNREFIINNFKETLDRKAIWIDKIDVTL